MTNDSVHLEQVSPGDYTVWLNGEDIGAVYRERQSVSRYAYSESMVARQGRWRWVASTVNDEDFATRREAVAELVRRRLRSEAADGR